MKELLPCCFPLWSLCTEKTQKSAEWNEKSVISLRVASKGARPVRFSPCLLIADTVSAPLWTARGPRWATVRSIQPVSIRTSSCLGCWWAGKWRRWACGFGCRSSAPDLRADSEWGSSCCDSSSAHRSASSSARPDWCGHAAVRRECSREYAKPPRWTWSCNSSQHCRCGLWPAADDSPHPGLAGSSTGSPELCSFVVSHFVDVALWSWCPTLAKKIKRVAQTWHSNQDNAESATYSVSNAITGECHDDLQLLGSWSEDEFVDFLAFISIQRHWEAVCTFHQNVMKLLEDEKNLFLQYPLELQLLKLETWVSISRMFDWHFIRLGLWLPSINYFIKQ